MSTLKLNIPSTLRGALLGAWLAVGAVGASALVAAPAAAEGQQVSKAVFDKYDPAREAYQKKDFTSALRLGKEALAAAKSAYEKQACLTIVYGAAVAGRNYQEAVDAGEQLLALDGVAAQTKLSTQKTLGALYAQLNKIDKAIATTRDYMKAVGGGSTADWDLLSQLYAINKDCPNSLQALDKVLAGGKQADEKQLMLQSNCFFKAHDTEKRLVVTEELLRRFPKRDYYNQLLGLYQEKKLEDMAMLELLRFGFEHDYLDAEADFVKLADLALDVGTTAEAERVLEKGMAKKLVKNADKTTRLLDQAKNRAVEDKKTIAQLDAEARAGKNGDSDVKVGYHYYSMGDFAKAAEAIQRGLQAERVARVKRVDDANMVLGISFLKLKKKADADKAFAAAKADPRMAPAAKVWAASAG